MIGRGRRADRFLATIVFTDMVGSTDLAAELGDREWRRVVGLHHSTVRQVLRRFGGHEIDTAGDGFLASFEQPAQAVRAADAILTELSRVGLELRAGIHTGEVEMIGGKVGGIAVHIAARVIAAAQAGEVLVSNTVRELVQGSGYDFKDRGVHELKGVPGEWHLFGLVRSASDESPSEGSARAADVRAATAAVAPARRWRRPAIAAVAVTVTIVVAASAALVLRGPTPVQAAPGPNSVVTVDRRSGTALEARGVPSGPVSMAIGDGQLWVGSLDAAVLTTLSTGGSAAAQTIGRVGQPTGIAIGDGVAWIADAFNQQISVVNTTSGDVERTLENITARRIAYGFDSAWATDDLDDNLIRLDGRSADVIATIPMGAGAYPEAVATGADAVWVGNAGTSTVSRVDPGNNTIAVDGIPLRVEPSGLAAGENDVWVISRAGDVLLRIDPATNSVAATIPIGDQPSTVIADGDTAWVGRGSAGNHELVHVDHDGSVLARLPLAGEPTALALDGDRLYVALRQP